MALAHFYLRNPGIRFLSRTTKKMTGLISDSEVIRLRNKNMLFKYLATNVSAYDVVLLTAHGSSDSILTNSRDLNKKFVRYIGEEETNGFSNKFIFAVSCQTANSFGKKCVENGANAYIGYNMMFGHLFNYSDVGVPGRICKWYNTLFKRIYLEELRNSLEEMYTLPVTAQYTKEKFAFRLEKRLYSIQIDGFKKTCEKYSLNIPYKNYSKYFPSLILKQITEIRIINKSIVCLGDINYISHHSLDNLLVIQKIKEDQNFNMQIKELIELCENTEYKTYLNKKFTSILSSEVIS